MFVWLLCDWLSEIRNFLKVKWEGIKWLSQTFTFLHFDLCEFKFFSNTKPSREDDITHLIKWKGDFEKIWTFFGNILNSETLSNSMISMREDKMPSSKLMKYESGVSTKQFSSPFEIIFNLELFGFLFKLFFYKNKIYGT